MAGYQKSWLERDTPHTTYYTKARPGSLYANEVISLKNDNRALLIFTWPLRVTYQSPLERIELCKGKLKAIKAKQLSTKPGGQGTLTGMGAN